MSQSISTKEELNNHTIKLYKFAIKQEIPFWCVLVSNGRKFNIFEYLKQGIDRFVTMLEEEPFEKSLEQMMAYVDAIIAEYATAERDSEDEEEASEKNTRTITQLSADERTAFQHLITCMLLEINNSFVFKGTTFTADNLEMIYMNITRTMIATFFAQQNAMSSEGRAQDVGDDGVSDTSVMGLTNSQYERVVNEMFKIHRMYFSHIRGVKNPDNEYVLYQAVHAYSVTLEHQRERDLKRFQRIEVALQRLQSQSPIPQKVFNEDGFIMKAKAMVHTKYESFDFERGTQNDFVTRSSNTAANRVSFNKELVFTQGGMTKSSYDTYKEEDANRTGLFSDAEVIRNSRDLESIFNASAATEFVPHIAIYLAGEGDEVISRHKSIRSEQMAPFLQFKDEKQRKDTIRFRVLTATGNPDNRIMKYSRSSRFSKMTEDGIPRVMDAKLNKDMFADVTINMKTSILRYQCPTKGNSDLVNQRIAEAFPNLMMSQFVQTRMCYTVIYEVPDYDDLSWLWYCSTDPTAQLYMFVDESKGNYASRKRVSQRYRGFLNNLNDDKEEESRERSSNQFTLSFRLSLVVVGTDIDNTNITQRRLKVRISKATSREVVNEFCRYFKYILANYVSNIHRFRDACGYHLVGNMQSVKEDTRQNRNLVELRAALGKMIGQTYGTFSTKNKQPTPIIYDPNNPDDVAKYVDENNDVEFEGTLDEGRVIESINDSVRLIEKKDGLYFRIYPRRVEGENGPVYLISRNAKYPFVIMEPNTISNSEEYPELPKCSATPIAKVARERHFLAGKNAGHIIKNNLAVQIDNYGTITPDVSQLMTAIEDGHYFRKGVIRDKSSLIHTVLSSLEEYVETGEAHGIRMSNEAHHYIRRYFFRNPDTGTLISNFSGIVSTDRVRLRKEVVIDLRLNILAYARIELCSQAVPEFVKYKNKYGDEVRNSEELFDATRYVRLLEEFFGIDIYVFGKSQRGEEANFLLPYHKSNSFMARAVKVPRRCICVYVVKVFTESFAQGTDYPQYESIIQSEREKPTRRVNGETVQIKRMFSAQVSRQLQQILQRSFNVITISGINSYINRNDIDPHEMSFIRFRSQLIDGKGKSQLFNGELIAEKTPITVMTIPLETINVECEDRKGDIPIHRIHAHLAIKYFGMPTFVSYDDLPTFDEESDYHAETAVATPKIRSKTIVGLHYSRSQSDDHLVFIPVRILRSEHDEHDRRLLLELSKLPERPYHKLYQLYTAQLRASKDEAERRRRTLKSFHSAYGLSQIVRWLFVVFYVRSNIRRYADNVARDFFRRCFVLDNDIDESKLFIRMPHFLPDNLSLSDSIQFVRDRWKGVEMRGDRIPITSVMYQRLRYQIDKLEGMSHGNNLVIPTEVSFQFSRIRTNVTTANMLHMSSGDLKAHIEHITGESVSMVTELHVSDVARKNVFIYRPLFDDEVADASKPQNGLHYLCVNVKFSSAVTLRFNEFGDIKDTRATHLLAICHHWMKYRRINIPHSEKESNGDAFSNIVPGVYDPNIKLRVYGINAYSNIAEFYTNITDEGSTDPYYEVVNYSSLKSSNNYCVLLRL